MKKLIPLLSVFAFISLMVLSGLSTQLSDKLTELRFKFFPQQATGKVVLVAIDAKSLQEITKWPWPRSIHAKLINKLTKAGATDIAFDIDFSSTTTEREDEALLKALKAAKGSIILPSFKQSQKIYQVNESDWQFGKPKTVIYSNPLAIYREHSWRASVNIFPGRNGLIHDIPFGHTQDGEFIPAISSILAGVYQTEEEKFHLDYSILASTVPTVSYSDVLNNKVRDDFFKDKKVIIGATATELGDHFYVPSQGIIPGPMLQALATETLLQKRKMHHVSMQSTFLVTLIIAGVVFFFSRQINLAEKLYTFAIAMIAIEAFALYLHLYSRLMVSTSLMHLCLLSFLMLILMKEINFKTMLSQQSRIDLANKKKIFEQVFKDSFTSTIITNKDGAVHFTNDKLLNLLSIPQDTNLIGKHFSEILPPEIAGAANRLLEQQSNDTTIYYSSHTDIQSPQGSIKTIEYIISLSVLENIEEKKSDNIISFSLQDITAKHLAEIAQKEATQAAVNANKAKTEFLTTMSHELRTPLNSILGFSEIIQNQSLGPNQMDKYIDFASDIQNSGRQLLKVVNNILEVTKMESGSIQLREEKCDVIEIIEDAIEETSYEFNGQSLNITFEHTKEIPGLFADADICKKAISAIISNAIKFSPTNEEIKITATKTMNGEMCISIADRGDGISRHEIENIFKPFYQIDSAKNRNYEGTGLGLTTANAYINLHRGSIKVDSALSKGTTIQILFPNSRTIDNPDSIINLNQPFQTERKSA